MSGFFGGGSGGATAASLDTRTVVADQTARFALTTDDVQNGDTVYQTDTGATYLVVDDTNLDSSTGYHLLPEAGVQYASSGAGTENAIQVPNSSGELVDTVAYWTAAGLMVGAEVAAARRLEVRDNSGNPQQRWAYDVSNYGERQVTSNGTVIETSTNNRFEFVHSSGGGEIILSPNTTSFTLKYSPTATSSVINVLTGTVDYAWLGQSGKNTLISGSRLGFFVGSSSHHVAQSTGWTIPATYTTRKTFSSSATVTLAELADVVATLITTLGDTSGYRLIAN